MAITLITGKPGHGKNIYCLTFLEKHNFINYDKESDTFHADSERPLFFISFDEISVLDSTVCTKDDLEGLPVSQEDKNTSIFPDNAVIVIDEAHGVSPKSGNKEGFTSFVSFLKIHRHYGFDFIFITQSQKDLNVDIRNLVEAHYWITRPLGMKKSFCNKFDGCETSENKKPISLESKGFKHDERYFRIYKSSTGHNFKQEIPKKYYFFMLLALIFIFFIFSRGMLVFDMFDGEDGFFGAATVSNVLPESQPQQTNTAAGSALSAKDDVFIPGGIGKTPYLYSINNFKQLSKHYATIKAVAPTMTFSKKSMFCYCNALQIEILDQMLPDMDISNNVKVEFILASFDESDFLDYSLKYTYIDGFFKIGQTANIANSLLFDYLEKDYKSLKKITSTALVEIGSSFNTEIVTKYPLLLKSFSNDREISSTRATTPPINTPTSAKKTDFSSEKVDFNDVGFKFTLNTTGVTDKVISVDIKQSHSVLLSISKDDIPIVSKRNFSSSFLLKEGSLVPLFNLSDLLNSKTKEQSVPFFNLFGFLPDKHKKSKTSYQIFLKFTQNRIHNPLSVAQKKAVRKRFANLIKNHKKKKEQKELQLEIDEYEDE